MNSQEKFVYVAVKDINKRGSIAVRIKASSALGLTELLESELDVKIYGIVMLNNPDMYYQYKPYDIKSNLKEFLDTVLV